MVASALVSKRVKVPTVRRQVNGKPAVAHPSKGTLLSNKSNTRVRTRTCTIGLKHNRAKETTKKMGHTVRLCVTFWTRKQQPAGVGSVSGVSGPGRQGDGTGRLPGGGAGTLQLNVRMVTRVYTFFKIRQIIHFTWMQITHVK